MSGKFSISLSQLPLGYVYGMGQPSIGISITLDALKHFATDAAHTALSEVFQMSKDDIPRLDILGTQNIPEVMHEFLLCAFALARSLLQDSGVPAFAQEKIHSIDKLPSSQPSYRLQFNGPAIENFDTKQIAAAYAHGLKLMSFFGQHEPDQKAFKQASDALADNFVFPLRRAVRQGLSTKPVLKEAFRRGIPLTHFGDGTYQLGFGAHCRLINKSATDADAEIGARFSADKELSETWFKDFGVPVAKTRSVRNAEAAVAAARELGYPIVLKPADLDRSEGVHLDLMNEVEVRDAFEQTRKLSRRILVQSRIPGHCHRLVTFKGQFVFAYTRHPAAIVGDGGSSIRKLVERWNQQHWQKAKHLQIKPLPFDEESVLCLQAQGLAPEKILEKDEVAFLCKNNTPDHAGHNEIVTDKIHPENKDLVERLARLFRLESVGADLISTDPSRPWYETGGAITEINFQPQIGENTARSNLEAMFPDQSRGFIPIECFVGGRDAMQAARNRLSAMAMNNVKGALTSHDVSLDSCGSPVRLANMKGLRDRCRVFLRDPDVEALIVVVQTNEFLISGPPFNGDVKIKHLDGDVRLMSEPTERLPKGALNKLAQVLQGG